MIRGDSGGYHITSEMQNDVLRALCYGSVGTSDEPLATWQGLRLYVLLLGESNVLKHRILFGLRISDQRHPNTFKGRTSVKTALPVRP
jgi:hypothetical protein